MSENKNLEISKKLDSEITQIFSNQQLQGFEKAVKLAEGMGQLRELLDENYMKSIMNLSGSKIGFRTDKDDKNKYPKGYPVSVVKDCLIEAVLMGLQPVNNMFNIIAGNCYVTKEGFGHLLEQENVVYSLRFSPMKIDKANSVASLDVDIEYFDTDGVQKNYTLPITTKWNAYLTDEAAQGKATRKARAWLYNKLKGTQISDSDVSDVPHVVVSDTLTKENLQDLLDEVSDSLSENERTYTQATIDEEREKDYKKAFNFLNSKRK